MLLALLLLLSLGLGGGLAVQSILTARQHRRTAERALQDYAGFAAFILASRTYRHLGGAVVETFARWPVHNGRPKLPQGTECAHGTTWVEDPPGAPGLKQTGVPLLPAEVSFLADTLKNAMALLEEVGWRFRFIRAPAGRFDGWLVTSYRATGGFGVRGFSLCLSGKDSPIRQVMLAEHALPPAVTGKLPPDSLYSIQANAGGQPPLYQSPVAYASAYQGSARLGTEFGDLTIDLRLRPDLANRLVIGGLPASRAPLAIGLLGLSTLLVITALLQLRREYELIAIRSDFVSNVSHELRTPLSQILIFTELLKLGRLRTPAERDRSIGIIDQEVRRLIRLVENVLQFSRASARRVQREPLPLSTLVEDTLEAFRPLAAAREVRLESAVPEGAVVLADPSAVRQILLNLLDNAIKYGPKGQTVRVGSEISNGHTRIVVDDQGPGIPFEDRERVWEGYYRLPRESRSAVAGSGIGLAVVRSLATEMGGRAWIADTDTGGARIMVELESGTREEDR